MMKQTSLARHITVEIPSENSADVDFLHELEEAHDHDNLKDVGAGVEKAFKDRVEKEFSGQDITPKTRASITDFCIYLMSIAKFYGYDLLLGGFITTVHEDMFSVRTQPTKGITALIESTFTYFDDEGNYKLTANGFMRRDWATAPDDPVSRRNQILRDNNDIFPGLQYSNANTNKLHIHIEITGQFPLLILPVTYQ
jgi:hypothetical protein